MTSLVIYTLVMTRLDYCYDAASEDGLETSAGSEYSGARVLTGICTRNIFHLC